MGPIVKGCSLWCTPSIILKKRTIRNFREEKHKDYAVLLLPHLVQWKINIIIVLSFIITIIIIVVVLSFIYFKGSSKLPNKINWLVVLLSSLILHPSPRVLVGYSSGLLDLLQSYRSYLYLSLSVNGTNSVISVISHQPPPPVIGGTLDFVIVEQAPSYLSLTPLSWGCAVFLGKRNILVKVYPRTHESCRIRRADRGRAHRAMTLKPLMTASISQMTMRELSATSIFSPRTPLSIAHDRGKGEGSGVPLGQYP